MRNLLPARAARLGWTTLGMGVCIAWATFVGSAVAADAPRVSGGQLKQCSDTTATIEFDVAPGDGENLEVVVFYGKEDGRESDDGWASNTGALKPEGAKGPTEYAVELTGLDPDMVYFYRIKAASTVGITWSEPGDLRTEKATTPLYITLAFVLIFFAMLIAPFTIGGWLARRWRMPDYGWKLGVILFSIVWGIYLVVGAVSGFTQPLSLGIDLSGGVVLVYELDEKPEEVPEVKEGDEEGERPEQKEEVSKIEMDKLISAVALRVNPGGTREVDIRRYGPKQIQIIIPRANPEEVKRIRSKISRVGTLAFRILADDRDSRHKQAITRARLTDADTVWSSDDPEEREELGWWVPVRAGREDKLAESGDLISRTKPNPRGKEVLEVLVVNDPYKVEGDKLRRCDTGIDEKGRPNVRFRFNRTGGQLFGWLTHDNRPNVSVQEFYRKLGIILDGRLYSAPIIKTVIHDQGEISGDFTQEQAQDLVDVLNAGSLPTALKKNPSSELKSGPTLGRDTIRRGAYSIVLSLAVVLVFMLVYYRFAGLVACGALLMTLLLLLAIMIAVKADFTLPGIAGLVLTVGMAVDANVLIFERIREELARDAALRMAIRNGFRRALSAIVDANLTTLITATLLWAIGTPQIKGFAVVLWLGVVLSMFTAIFCSRVVFDIAERRRWIKKLTMMHLIGRTSFNFIGMRKIGAAVSVTLIIIGMVSVVARGKGLLDIDFTGGESIQLLFKKDQGQRTADIRKTLEDARDKAGEELFPDLAVTDTKLPGEGEGLEGLRFIINTSRKVEEDKSAIDVVQEDLRGIFGDKLDTNRMTVGAMKPIGRPVQPKPTESEPAKPAENEQSLDDLPPRTLLASTDPAAVLLAQAGPTAQPSDKPPAEELEKTPAEEAKAKPGDKPTETKPAEEEPREQPETKDDAKPAAEDAKAKPADKQPVEKPADAPAPAPVKPTARFEGGTEVALNFEHELDYETLLEDIIKPQLAKVNLDTIPFDLSNETYEPGDTEAYHDWVLLIKLPEDELKEKVLGPIEEQMAATPFFPSSSSIGGKVAGDMQVKAIYALLGSLICIIGYLWIRFQRVSYGLAAVVALVHDVLVTLGALAISAYLVEPLGFLGVEKFKISLSVLAAFLTIIGYSLNDTIVVFDRIREVKGKSPDLTGDIINTSINQTLSRTLLTSLTTLIVVVILYFGGGTGLHPFAYSLLVGVIVGTYSSIFVASPVLYWMSKPAVGRAKRA